MHPFRRCCPQTAKKKKWIIKERNCQASWTLIYGNIVAAGQARRSILPQKKRESSPPKAFGVTISWIPIDIDRRWSSSFSCQLKVAGPIVVRCGQWSDVANHWAKRFSSVNYVDTKLGCGAQYKRHTACVYLSLAATELRGFPRQNQKVIDKGRPKRIQVTKKTSTSCRVVTRSTKGNKLFRVGFFPLTSTGGWRRASADNRQRTRHFQIPLSPCLHWNKCAIPIDDDETHIVIAQVPRMSPVAEPFSSWDIV